MLKILDLNRKSPVEIFHIKHKVMPPRCLPLRAACGEKLICSACVSRAARDDRIVREPRASRVARRGRRRGRRRAANALGGGGATASSHEFSRFVALPYEQTYMDGPDRVVRFSSTSEIRMEVRLTRTDRPSELFIIRGRSHSGKLAAGKRKFLRCHVSDWTSPSFETFSKLDE